MSNRKSDDDIRKYLPDLDAVLRAADPEAAKERRRAALAEFEGDQEEDAEETTSPRVAGAGAAASPWAGTGAGGIDKAALPSSLAPGVVPPVTTPIPKEGAEEQRRAGGFPGWLKGVAAVIGVLGPVVVLLLLQNLPSGKTTNHGEGTSAALTSTGVAAVRSAAAPAESATAMATASSVVPAIPVTGSAVVPVLPVAPGATSGDVPKKPKGKAPDPYDAAPPAPAKTAAPASTPNPPPGPVPMFEREQ